MRNELAHGSTSGCLDSGSLVLARDHLHLWLEQMLLGVMAYTQPPHRGDWLRGQVANQQVEIAKLQAALRESLSP